MAMVAELRCLGVDWIMFFQDEMVISLDLLLLILLIIGLKFGGCTLERMETEALKEGIRHESNVGSESMFKIAGEDDEELTRLRMRIDRLGIEIPQIEVRFQHLSVDGKAYVGTRALPSLLNTTLNAIEDVKEKVGLSSSSKKRVVKILHDMSGIVKPRRLTLLLGPPGSGKTMLLSALSGKLTNDLGVTGEITYCGHDFSEFIPQKTCAYISQHDLHCGQLTVRETLDFSRCCMGVGARYQILMEMFRDENGGIPADQDTELITDYILKMLKLDNCADIMVGDELRRGISGGEKKRVTTGEMLVGSAGAFFMDEISTGLDSCTTFNIVKFLRQMVHLLDMTMVISLLQPMPETFDLFDDVMLLSEGQIVYQGPRDSVLDFFEYAGFKCPERKEIAEFLQEITSRKDQEQYWFRKKKPYRYISVPEFVKAFNSFHIGKDLSEQLRAPFEKSKAHPDALTREKYGISKCKLLKICLSREWLLMKRNSIFFIFKITQITVIGTIAFTVFSSTKMKVGERKDAAYFAGALFFGLTTFVMNAMMELAVAVLRLPLFFKQRDSMLYPAWAFGIPILLFSIPVSLIEAGIWVSLTYYTIGFAPAPTRFLKQFLGFFSIYQTILALSRFISVIGRTLVVAYVLGFFTLVALLVLGGFIIAKDNIEFWMRWGCYLSPIMYGQNAISMNEFLDERWNILTGDSNEATVGISLLKGWGFFIHEYWYWICIGALAGFSLIFNILFIAALEFVKAPANSKVAGEPPEDDSKQGEGNLLVDVADSHCKNGMILPFQPLSLAFNNVSYYLDMPAAMKAQGNSASRLQLLRNVSGAFRPGILTALVGVSGAGKTTLMDVLIGRKNVGYIEGTIRVSGYVKNQTTFSRVCGYCEQNDIHSPYLTVYESLLHSASLRLPANVKQETKKMFIDEVMELVELRPLKNALVGQPRIDGLSTEQRKRLTIAVELVANPSIIFMDEPTSGLDARAAAVVIRTIRHTADTGRTVVCTIHQPSIDIFEAFDELLLMKRGGEVIYAGPLGCHSSNLVEYFEAVPGVPKIEEGSNPATWVLEISSSEVEDKLGVDFAEVYANSDLCRKNQKIIRKLSTQRRHSMYLHFSTRYSQSFMTQCKACFWKQYWSYWRNSNYNVTRFFVTVMIAMLFGLAFWNKGDHTRKPQDIFNILGVTYAAILFLGGANASTVQPVFAMERTVFYRERTARMYSVFPYAFALVAVETIYVSIQTLIYALLLYSVIGFEWKVAKFLYFYFFIFTSFTYFSMFGLMVIALTPNPEIAGIVLSFFLSFWNLFSGYLLTRPLLHSWWRWYYWANPVAWTIYGILVSQIGDENTPVEIPGSEPIPLIDFLKKNLGYDHHFLHLIVLAHVAWVLLFLFVFAYAIKFVNHQRR